MPITPTPIEDQASQKDQLKEQIEGRAEDLLQVWSEDHDERFEVLMNILALDRIRGMYVDQLKSWPQAKHHDRLQARQTIPAQQQGSDFLGELQEKLGIDLSHRTTTPNNRNLMFAVGSACLLFIGYSLGSKQGGIRNELRRAIRQI